MENNRWLFLFFTVITIACNDDRYSEESLTTNYFYDRSHACHMKVSGNVKTIQEYKEDPDDPTFSFLSAVITFNQYGNLVSYDPTGDLATDTQLYWLPFETKVYKYDYDTQNRLSKVNVILNHTDTVWYKLNYGSHDCYLPLPFDLEPIGEWLVKGLVSIESNHPDFYYHFDGQKLISRKNNEGMAEAEQIIFQHNYPYRSELTVSDSNQELRKTETSWQYTLPAGIPSEKKEIVTTEGTTYVAVTNYDGNGLKISYSDGALSSQLTCQYNQWGWLIGKLVMTNQIETGRQKSLFDVDAQNNWIRHKRTTTGFIGWDQPSGTEIITRTIIY
ncbi:MAG: hypothetical protein RR837_04905 [Bacteroidales bacterium]